MKCPYRKGVTGVTPFNMDISIKPNEMRGFETMARTQKRARVRWDKDDHKWVIELWDDNTQTWDFSIGCKVKGENPKTGIAWVSDALLCEIAKLQDWGWEVIVKIN